MNSFCNCNNILHQGMRIEGENRRFSSSTSRTFSSAVQKEFRTPSCKGVHPFIAATMLILVTVVLATLVSGFVVNVSSERSKVILNATQSKLNCQYAGILVTNVTYDCNSACFTGSPYRINATIENTGSSKVQLSSMFVTLSDGTSYRLDGNLTSMSAGDITTKLFNAILVRSNPKMPTETMDTRNEYVNGTNTNLLCHFESTPTCIAKTDGAGNAAGASYESGKFSNAVKINETDTLAYNATANINASQGTIEFWFAPNWSADSTRKSLVSIAGVDVNITGEWRFEEQYYNISLKNVTDTSGYGNNGSYNGEGFNNGTIIGANWTAGKYGSALMFNGTDPQTYVQATETNATNVTLITIEAWIRVKGRSTHPGNEYIIHKGVNNAPGGGYSIQFGSVDNQTMFIFFTNETGTVSIVSATNSILYNAWYHVAGTYNGTMAISYINGVEAGRSSATGIINSTTNPLTIGMRSDYANVPFNGTIDEVRIYNYALSGEEINASMNSAYPVNRTVASYSFEEQGGNTAYDTHNRVAGQYGGAMSFDGIDDVVTVPAASSPSVNTTFTLMAWVKEAGRKDAGGVLGRYNQDPLYYLMRVDSGVPSCEVTSGGTLGSGVTIPIGTWAHLACTYDNSTGNMKIYVDGVERVSATRPAPTVYSAYSLRIGEAHSTQPFNGTIDEVRIYNRSLTAEEINATYHAGLGSGFAKDNDMMVFKWGSNATMANISSWSANAWHHVAGAWDSSFVKLYTDGNLQSTARSVLPSSINDTLYVGSHSTGTKQANAWFDELRISNSTRNFTVTLIANVTYPGIDTVRVYNHANTLMNTSTLNSVPTYNVSLNLSASSEYRVEVTDTSGNKYEKWYPYRTGGACIATTTLDRISFSTANCPEVTDTYYGTDVTFANCP